jgi:shikimate dehydrogenase
MSGTGMRTYAVAGRPIGFSRSPDLFNKAFAAASMDAAYTRMACASAEEAVRIARVLGLDGFNVTSPFKETIVPLLDSLDATAVATGAVNTVANRNGRFRGSNTDVDGVLGALVAAGVEVRGRRALVLGAGGAAKAAAYALRKGGAARVVIANRTAERAKEAAFALRCEWVPAADVTDATADADIVVSCLPAGLSLIEHGSLLRGRAVLDASYTGSMLATGARTFGYRFVGGMEWLVHQAAAGFRHFTGVAAPVHAMRAAADDFRRRHDGRVSRIALVGFMGAGKSTVGPLLARRLGYEFHDIDWCVEGMTGTDVATVFKTKGEAFFRAAESSELRRLAVRSNVVIAAGGGAVLSERNREILSSSCTVVWLAAPFEACIRRAGGPQRPLLHGKDEGDAHRLFRERLPLYLSTSDIVFDSAAVSGEELAERIAGEIRSAVTT